MAPRILHVDDSEDIRMVVLLALETIGGLEVVQCSSGAEALELAPSSRADLFLLDVMMPDLTGPETLIRLRQMPQFALTPAIFLTAKVVGGEISKLRALGASDVIIKPFDPMVLASEIVAIWERLQKASA